MARTADVSVIEGVHTGKDALGKEPPEKVRVVILDQQHENEVNARESGTFVIAPQLLPDFDGRRHRRLGIRPAVVGRL